MFRAGLQQLAAFGTRQMATVARPAAPLASTLRAGFFPGSKAALQPSQQLYNLPGSQPFAWTSRLPQVPVLPETPLKEYLDLDSQSSETMHMDSVLRKRRLKMKKHKLRKRRRTQRALKKRLGKI